MMSDDRVFCSLYIGASNLNENKKQMLVFFDAILSDIESVMRYLTPNNMDISVWKDP